MLGGRTVPRIFVDGKFIGGADDVTAMDARGDLEALLREKSLITAR
jgi:glutaredoxin 3